MINRSMFAPGIAIKGMAEYDCIHHSLQLNIVDFICDCLQTWNNSTCDVIIESEKVGNIL